MAAFLRKRSLSGYLKIQEKYLFPDADASRAAQT
jgi:hypothetical protein